jgi:hypothetical protein
MTLDVNVLTSVMIAELQTISQDWGIGLLIIVIAALGLLCLHRS